MLTDILTTYIPSCGYTYGFIFLFVVTHMVFSKRVCILWCLSWFNGIHVCIVVYSCLSVVVILITQCASLRLIRSCVVPRPAYKPENNTIFPLLLSLLLLCHIMLYVARTALWRQKANFGSVLLDPKCWTKKKNRDIEIY